MSQAEKAINETRLSRVAQEISAVWPAFDSRDFVMSLVKALPKLGLKARISATTDALHAHLPPRFPEAVGILRSSLPILGDELAGGSEMGEYTYAPYSTFVSRYGLAPEHLQVSLAALHSFTRYFSAEDAIRPFLEMYPTEILLQLEEWTSDPDFRVRRLVSEGTRPRLPWSTRLSVPPTTFVPLLDRLREDRADFVVRSVANHLNDISYSDPGTTIETLRRWNSERGADNGRANRFTRMALRSLVKQGDPEALALLGVNAQLPIEVRLTREGSLGPLGPDAWLEVAATLHSAVDAQVIVDLVVVSTPAKGTRARRSVFRVSSPLVPAGVPIAVHKRVAMRPTSTRSFLPGPAAAQLQVNGQVAAEVPFEIAPSERLI